MAKTWEDKLNDYMRTIDQLEDLYNLWKDETQTLVALKIHDALTYAKDSAATVAFKVAREDWKTNAEPF